MRYFYYFQLTIKTNTFMCSVKEEYINYDVLNLLSDIGGMVGGYLGISFMSLFELFKYLSETLHSKEKEKDTKRQANIPSISKK